MYPVLFTIPLFGGITIYSYGVMVAMGFVAAMAWVMRESRRLGQSPARMMDLAFWVIIAGILGSRLLHVAVSERERFLADPLMFFRLWEGGLVFYGGLIASFAVGVWYIRKHRMPVLTTLDIFAPAISIGHAVGRVGCFLAGCCYGRSVGHGAWYALTFPAGRRSFAPAGEPLYPTQLMEVAGELAIFTILILLRRFKRFDGELMLAYAMLYALLRFANEFFRGDAERGYVAGSWLSTSQLISLAIFAAGAAVMALRWRRPGGREGGR